MMVSGELFPITSDEASRADHRICLVCRTCGRARPEHEFPWSVKKSSGKHYRKRDCKSCRSAYAERHRKEAGARGVCSNCKKRPGLPEYPRYCFVCYMKVRAKAVGLRADGGKAIMLKFAEQNGRCALTGVELSVFSAHLDHIMPRLKYPEQAGDVSNIRWVSEHANRGKGGGTDIEFYRMCAAGMGRFLERVQAGEFGAGALGVGQHTEVGLND